MAKKAVKLTKVWHADGHTEEHTADNAKDMVRYSHWSYAPFTKAGRRMTVDPNSQPVENTGDVLNALEGLDAGQVPELGKLRDRAAQLGIAVDKRWGIDRIKEEIAGVTPGDNDDDGTSDEDEA